MKTIKLTALLPILLLVSFSANANNDVWKKKYDTLAKRYTALNKEYNQLKFKFSKQAECNTKKPKLPKESLW